MNLSSQTLAQSAEPVNRPEKISCRYCGGPTIYRAGFDPPHGIMECVECEAVLGMGVEEKGEVATCQSNA